MRIYISGAIGSETPDTPEDRRKRFHDMEERLAAAGHEPINPIKVPACSPIPNGACGRPVKPEDPESHSWQCYMRYDIRALMECDAVVALHNWNISKGSVVEVNLARALDIPVWGEFIDNGTVLQTSGPVTVAGLGV